MKLTGQVRAVERAMGNRNASQGDAEKRTFKIDVRPTSKPDSYYGYGSMQFVLHGRELEESGLDLSTEVTLYLVRSDAADEVPPVAAIDDLRRELYEAEQRYDVLKKRTDDEKKRYEGIERGRFDAGEKMKALQAENVRLTVQMLALQGATGMGGAPIQLIDNA